MLLAACLPGEYKLDDEVWAEVHDSAKDMISHMMVVDPAQRWSARDLLNHKWFQVRDGQQSCSQREILPRKLARQTASCRTAALV